ncbi:MAG: DUF4920 domain-containing protein [Nannocystaceae bacterium]
MKLHVIAVSLLSTLALAACEQKPAPAPEVKAEAAAPADATKPAGDAVAAKAPAEEGEEGCVYGDHHKEAAEQAGEAGCGHGEHGAGGDGGPGHFGAAFALGESKPLSEVLASAPDGAVQVRGEIDSVCQKAGCWMVLKEGEMKARILMKDHSFTVPMDSKGKPAVVEGTIETRTFNEKEVKHLEKDGGGDPSEVTGERKEFVLTASGIQITNS